MQNVPQPAVVAICVHQISSFGRIDMISFSSEEDIQKVRQKLYDIRPGLLKSLELERITLFPKVVQRLNAEGLKAVHVNGRMK